MSVDPFVMPAANLAHALTLPESTSAKLLQHRVAPLMAAQPPGNALLD